MNLNSYYNLIKTILIAFSTLLVSNQQLSFSQNYEATEVNRSWYLELNPPIILDSPVCPEIKGLEQKSSIFRLCLPSAKVDGLKIKTDKNKVLLSGAGLIQGPVLVKSIPPIIIFGAMKINKGSLELTVSKGGGYSMRGLDGIFEIEGLIAPILASKPLELTDIEIEFTSPEDALLHLTASGQKAAVVLRVAKNSTEKLLFSPSPANYSILPNNKFFTEFEGEIKGQNLNQKLIIYPKDGSKFMLSLKTNQ